MEEKSRGGIVAGVVLLLLGVLLLATQLVPEVRRVDLWSLFPLLAGVVLLAGFAYSRQYGTLIPGCILTGLGAGMLVAKLPGTMLFGVDPTVTGLGLGFLAIYPVDLAVRGRQPGQWWPLIPGAIILAAGLARTVFHDFWQLAPALALIVIGGAILARAFGGGPSDRSGRRADRAQRRTERHGGGVPAQPEPAPASAPPMPPPLPAHEERSVTPAQDARQAASSPSAGHPEATGEGAAKQAGES